MEKIDIDAVTESFARQDRKGHVFSIQQVPDDGLDPHGVIVAAPSPEWMDLRSPGLEALVYFPIVLTTVNNGPTPHACVVALDLEVCKQLVQQLQELIEDTEASIARVRARLMAEVSDE